MAMDHLLVASAGRVHALSTGYVSLLKLRIWFFILTRISQYSLFLLKMLFAARIGKCLEILRVIM